MSFLWEGCSHIVTVKDIACQDTHLDSLTYRFPDPRIRANAESMVAGRILENVPSDDSRFGLDLELVRTTSGEGLLKVFFKCRIYPPLDGYLAVKAWTPVG